MNLIHFTYSDIKSNICKKRVQVVALLFSSYVNAIYIWRSTIATAAALKYSQALMFIHIPEASFAFVQVHTFIHNIYIYRE